MTRMENSLSSKGVVFYDPLDNNLNITSEFLILPSEITEVSSKDLGEYLNAITQQKMYYRTLLGRLELVVEEKRRVYYEESANLYNQHTIGSKMSETAKIRLVNSDPDVRPSYLDYRDEKQRLNLLLYSISSLEEASFLVSREISRRVKDYEEDTRNFNVSKK